MQNKSQQPEPLHKSEPLKPEIKNEKKQRLVQKFMQQLMQQDPSLYYASTTDIAQSLQPMIMEHMNRMSVEEQALFRNITVRDIEMLLSFNK